MKYLCLFSASICLVLGGCLIAPVKPVGSITDYRPAKESQAHIFNRAKECWKRKAGLFHDAILVRYKSFEGNRLIIVSKDARDIDRLEIARFNFLRVSDTETLIEMKEGGYAIGVHLDLSSDVKRWVAGDASCRKLPNI